jgi:hypothetical protein
MIKTGFTNLGRLKTEDFDVQLACSAAGFDPEELYQKKGP